MVGYALCLSRVLRYACFRLTSWCIPDPSCECLEENFGWGCLHFLLRPQVESPSILLFLINFTYQQQKDAMLKDQLLGDSTFLISASC